VMLWERIRRIEKKKKEKEREKSIMKNYPFKQLEKATERFSKL
jgi:hypothetical protein